MRSFPFLVLSFLLLACNDSGRTGSPEVVKDTGTSSISQEEQAPPVSDISGCYMRVLQRDTLVAVLEQSGNAVTGQLSFDNYEKDGSTGSVKGTISNGIIKLLYSFRSEGMKSVMEVNFKITDRGIIHGFGDVGVKGDTAYYSDPAHISYPNDDLLVKLPCEQVAPKYKQLPSYP